MIADLISRAELARPLLGLLILAYIPLQWWVVHRLLRVD